MLMRIARFEVMPDTVQGFEAATLTHVAHSQAEPGVHRFEFYEEEGENRFLLLIHFDSPEARDEHFTTDHYREWREQITPMLAKSIEGLTCFPVKRD